jgi:hypothetical protein
MCSFLGIFRRPNLEQEELNMVRTILMILNSKSYLLLLELVFSCLHVGYTQE